MDATFKHRYLQIIVLIIGILLPWTDSGNGDPYASQPRIVIQNGHLIFQTAQNHNISFVSTRGGSIRINNDDLVHIVEQAKSSTANLQQLGISSINVLTDRVNTLQSRFDEIQGLIGHLQEMQENYTRISNQVNEMYSQFSRMASPRGVRLRVRTLENKVRQLNASLLENNCDSNPCRNGATCVDAYKSYNCQCLPGWQGISCEEDVNECMEFLGTGLGCQNSATCMNSIGSYSCNCPPNWYGVHCTEPHDDCSTGSHQALCGQGICVNAPRVLLGQPKYDCICNQGWTKAPGSPTCIIDVDECSGQHLSCSQNPPVRCINLPGTFHCDPCPSGYTGNGHVCNDVNECATNNGGCSTTPMVQCINTPGSRICSSCPPGYNGDGTHCYYIEICNVNNGGCHPQATCVRNTAISSTYRECHCPSGFSGNGVGPNGCSPSLGTACESNPCVNGRCQVLGTSYRCICSAGYTGSLCDSIVDACHSNPCRNGGTCTVYPNGFTCSCTANWQGSTCEDEIESCGGQFQSETGNISYPSDRTAQYQHGVSCNWIIGTINPNKVLNLTFVSFNLEYSYDCAYDFLQINDGYSITSRLIGRFCGNQPPGNGSLITTHDIVYLWFKSDESEAADGFQITWTSIDPVCGGMYSGSNQGSVQSPGYPVRYPHNRDCYWKIEVPSEYRIKLNIMDLRIEHHDNCSFDFLQIFDGLSEEDPILMTFCGLRTNVPALVTSGPSALLYFHTDDSFSDAGFHIAYFTENRVHGCGGLLTDVSGQFNSPRFPNAYYNNLRCEWLIRLHSGERIQLNFTSFDIEAHVQCGYDYVEVIDGEHEGGPIIGRFCNAIRPPVILSSSNKLRIIFVTDSTEIRNGFSVTYTTACGGTFTALNGYLHSPNYPDRYPASKTCNYVISVPRGNIIEINFLFFDIESSYNVNCFYDYLEIRDVSETGSELARLCGNSIPGIVHSSFNQIWMKFVTDNSVQNLGFLLNYTSIEMGCGGVLTESTGIISSPNSLTEQGFMTCNWLLRAGSGYVVKLNFLTFSLRSTTECVHEYVEIFDSDGEKINRFCGEQSPPALTSTDNEMKITFRTLYEYLPSGFSASYIYLNFLHACGGTFYRQSGEVKSPGYPNHYPHRRDCIWILQTANNKQISLNVSAFQLESHFDCIYDFLEIRNGGYNTSPLVGKYCGDRGPSNFTSHSNTLWLHFVSDSSMSAPGFQIFYDSTAEGCGGIITSPEGSLISPNYPEPYHHNADCTWLIQVAQGSVIKVYLRDVDLESHSTCDFDFLQIFDGNSERARTIIKVCGNQQFNDHFVSTGNSLYIKFRSDYSANGRGFRLTYQVDCNSVLKGHRGVIESPNFPSPYPHNLNCTWTIEAPVGNNVSIAFSHLILEPSSNCLYDFLEIAERAYNVEHQIVKYCGADSLPEPVITSQNIAIIRFISDYSIAMDGFRLEWQVKGCGGHIRKAMGQIQSPNYPNSYPLTVLCVWYITVSPGYKIQFTVDHIDIEKNGDCTFDYVAVYGGEDTNSPQIHIFCGAVDRPQTITTHGNHMTVQFYSDYSVTGMGFTARFEAVEGGCGGVYTANSGTLVSPNYPGNFDVDDDCTWSLEVDNNHLIQLTIEDFDISPASTNCTRSYLAIYDGASEDEQLLLRHCGNSVPSIIMYQSTSNQLFLRMKADGEHSSRGFKASYIIVCGAKIQADEGGEIMSLNYPHRMQTLSECNWILYSSDLSEKVTVIVTDLSTTENYNVNCSSDYVEIRSGMDSTSPLLQKFCGNRVPPPITSPGNALHIFFQGNIFRATYGVSTNACGGTMVAEHGTFTSPDYPNSYPNDIECVWNLSASAGNKLQLAFSFFGIEESDYCNTDYVEIREDSDHGNLIGKYCGNDLPGNVSRISGKFWIKFRSDEQGTGQGFIASYSLVHGIQLSGTEGIIESPGYPSRTLRSEEFTWTITVPVQRHVRIQFLQIDLEEQHGYCDSYVTISDGSGQYAVELQTYCTRTIPEAVVTTNNIATVVFFNGYNPGRWRLQWTAVSEISSAVDTTHENACWENIDVNATNTTILSPGYPGQYENNMNCTWIINSEERRHVKIDFVDIDIDGWQPECYFDRVFVYEALHQADHSWNKIGTVCGHRASPVSFSGNTSVMKLEFVTNSYYTRTGFKAMARSECGGRLFASRGILNTSDAAPSYGRPPCEWVIVVRPGRTIRLTFEDFNIADDSSCSSQYLLIRNGGEASSPFLGTGKYCNSIHPNTLETSSNQVFIQLTSQYNYYSRQQTPHFRLRYEEISVGCGGQTHLTNDNPSVIITSPNHPNPPPHDSECEWVVMGPPNTRLRIDFNSRLDMEYGCYRDEGTEFVEVIDGGTINSDSLGKHCGQQQPSSILSTSNIMSVRYLTSARQPHSGFNATIQIAVCGGMIYGFNFTVTSPNYPLNYSNDMECEWIMKTSLWQIFKIYFEDMAIDDNFCHNDYVLLREVSATGYFLGKKCGMTNISNIITSEQSTVYLKFKTNATGTARGFKIRFVAETSDCGGELRSPSSVIQSPGFPYSTNYRRFCSWKIYVEEGRIITFTFNWFNLRQDPINHTCINALMIWNGTDSRWNAPEGVRYCGNNIPARIDSIDNSASVYYYSFGNSGSEGFKLTYTSDKAVACGGNLPYPNGTFSSPGFENGTRNDTFDCPWRLRNEREVSATLAVQFDILDLPALSNHTCDFDYILIQEGDITNVNHNSRRICGNFTQQNLLVSTPATGLLVYLRKNSSESVRGFNASYTIQECGGQIEIGTDIKSPSFPNNYPTNSVCHWRLDTEAGNQIKLTLSEFVLESDCSKDYVEIHNGQHYNSPVLGKYCGNQIPAEITSESNHLTIIFHSDNSGSAKGFHFTTSIVQRGCGGILRDVGIFSSPTAGNSTLYPKNVECVWLLETDIDYHHNVTFINRFDIEMEQNCNNDYVKVEDYENNNWKLLNKFCGNNRPPPVIGKSNHMRVTFQSNAQVQADGFTIAHSVACGRTFFMENEGIISSPGYPRNYIDYLTCEYRILNSPNSYITLEFDGVFSIENHPTCAYDSLIVYGGNSTSSPQIGNFCGNSVPDPVSSMGAMLLVFKTDYVVTKQGFRATFRISECGGQLNNSQGVLKSPITPAGIRHSLNCFWKITAEPDKVIELRFTSFAVGEADCMHGKVTIFDSNITYFRRLGDYCGTTLPPIVKSSGRYLTVALLTSNYNYLGNFEAEYRTTIGPAQGCGGQTTNESGEITSPGFNGNGNNYTSLLDCIWYIHHQGKVIQLNFILMDIEPGPFNNGSCPYDYLEIRDGFTSVNPIIGKYCGNQLPGNIVSLTERVMLHFHSDSTIEGRGFKVSYRAVEPTCGGSLFVNNTSQSLTSIGYPLPYEPNLRCHWRFYINSYSRDSIELTFNDMDILCGGDYLQIRENGMDGMPLQLCGQNNIHHFRARHGLSLTFNSDSEGSGRGFSLSYATAGCTRNYTRDNGVIYNPRFPSRWYQPDENCDMIIFAQEDHTIALYFNVFQYSYGDLTRTSCAGHGMEIHEGTDANGGILGFFCNRLPNPVFSRSNALFIRVSPQSYPGIIYSVSYTTTNQGPGCGGNLTSINGTFTSPRYPFPCNITTECHWYITVPGSHTLTLNFPIYELNSTRGCTTNYMEIYESHEEADSNRVARYCGTDQPAVYTSQSSTVMVKMATSRNNNAPGFVAKFYTNSLGSPLTHHSRLDYRMLYDYD